MLSKVWGTSQERTSWTRMTRYIVDSWAWMEYLDGSPAGARVRDEIERPTSELFTHAVTLAEIVSKVRRRGAEVDVAWKAITTNSKILTADKDDSRQVGLLHATMKSRNPNFTLADAFVLASSRKMGAKVLTGDPDFRGVENAIMLS